MPPGVTFRTLAQTAFLLLAVRDCFFAVAAQPQLLLRDGIDVRPEQATPFALDFQLVNLRVEQDFVRAFGGAAGTTAQSRGCTSRSRTPAPGRSLLASAVLIVRAAAQASFLNAGACHQNPRG